MALPFLFPVDLNLSVQNLNLGPTYPHACGEDSRREILPSETTWHPCMWKIKKVGQDLNKKNRPRRLVASPVC